MAESLPSKDASNFRAMVRLYEAKDYKKALKQADAILKTHASHGETLSMKGLILSQMGDAHKASAYEHAKKGLANGIKSHVCWHVYGLLYRQDRRYTEAAKSYKNALRIDPTNSQIWRDLALLQAHMRDWAGCVESRRKILESRPTGRMSWFGLALAYYFNKNYDMCIKVIDAYLASVTSATTANAASEESLSAYDKSEIKLFKARVFLDSGDSSSACKILNEASADGSVLDSQALHVLLSEAPTSTVEQKKKSLKVLLARNPANLEWVRQFCNVVQFSADELAQLKQDVPGVNRTLDFVMLEQLVSSGNSAPADVSMAIANFLRPLLDRSAPALFAIIRPLCNGERSVLSYVIDILERESTSSAVAWLSLARAHLHAGRPDLALAVLDKHEKQEGNGALAEDLKPDVLLVRAKVLRKLGRFSDAVVAAEAARQLDLNDRYLCSKAVKAMLVANDVSAAEKTMQIFATKEAGPIDMQTIWYELLMTDAHVRLGALDKAYDMARTTVKHVDDFREDEYDFHTYSLRKATLSAYIDLLRTSDRWFAHPAFRRAATSMIDISLVLEKDAKEREETVARLSKGAFMEEANVDMLTWAVMVRSYVHSKKLLLAVKCALRGMAKAKRIISSADVGRFYVECKSLVQKFNQLASAKVSTFGKEPLAEVEQWVSAFETSAGTSNEYVLAAAVITGAEKLEVLETKVVTAIQQAAVGTNQRQQLLQLVTLMQRCGGVAAEQRLREHVKSI